MNNIICKGIKVKFSIPGRIRLKINFLYKNIFFAQKLSETIKRKSDIVSVFINTNTYTLLIIYNHEKLSEKELKLYIETCFTELNFIQKNDDNIKNNSIYEGEKAISKRLILISGILIGMLSIGSFNIATVISIMILASPFNLFYIRNKGYKITSNLLSQRKIDLQNNSCIKILSKTEEIFIQDNLIINKDVVKQYNNSSEKKGLSIRKSVIYGNLEEPVFFYCDKLVRNLRNIGVNKISILSKKTSVFINYAKSTLGINSLTLEECYITTGINNILGEPLIILICNNKYKNVPDKSLGIYIYTQDNKIKYNDTFSVVLCKKHILELPYLILICKHMEITINNNQNISLAINMLGIILVMSNLFFIKGSIFVCFLNFILSNFLLKIDSNKNHFNILKSLK